MVALAEGGLLVHITLLSGSFEVEISPSKGLPRFDDNRWHGVAIERKSREVSSLELGQDGLNLTVKEKETTANQWLRAGKSF